MWGLALEGGGTKGAYHIGVFKAITELKIPIKCVVGTSIGAINGALFAQGDIERLLTLWRDISINNIVALPDETPHKDKVFDIKNLGIIIREMCNKKGLDISPFEKLLRSVIDEEKLRNGDIELGLATFCITGKTEKQLFLSDIPEGMLVDYLLASACFPGFQVRNIDDNLYIDGGVANNLPLDMLISQGCKDIISVEVGGLGLTKRPTAPGFNIITVKCSEDIVGNLDFNHEGILEAEGYGYCDTLKAFGICMGSRYTFPAVDYLFAKRRFSDTIIRGLQSAARYYEIDRKQSYSFLGLVGLVLDRFHMSEKHPNLIGILRWSDSEKVTCLAGAVLDSNTEALSNKIIAGILGDMFEAASAVAYFERYMQNIQ